MDKKGPGLMFEIKTVVSLERGTDNCCWLDGIIPSQAGWNKGDSQKLMTGFGTPRNTSTRVRIDRFAFLNSSCLDQGWVPPGETDDDFSIQNVSMISQSAGRVLLIIWITRANKGTFRTIRVFRKFPKISLWSLTEKFVFNLVPTDL